MVLSRKFANVLFSGVLMFGSVIGSTSVLAQGPSALHLADETPNDDSVSRPRRVAPTLSETPVEPEPLPLPAPPPLVRPKTFFLTNDDFPSGTRIQKTPASFFADRMQSAIDQKLGVRYRYNGEGDGGYDCSGFVWSVFRDLGVNFTRSSAASYFHTFPEVSTDERNRFGTLIFFNNLTHVGIVKDADHFYHASPRFGIVLSRLDNYWKPRVTGYRAVPNLGVTGASTVDSQSESASR